jgi:hypothetical protein
LNALAKIGALCRRRRPPWEKIRDKERLTLSGQA